MSGASPPPFNNYDRYALIPASLSKQIKTAAYGDGADVTLDMSLLVEGQGQEVYVIDTVGQTGDKSLHHVAKKEHVWKLKPGLQEDDDYVYISHEGWDKITAG